jgi:tetratricopeptide (TPR) repeat protein
MEGKLNVLLVIGKSHSMRVLDLFEPLQGDLQLSAAVFLHELRKPHFVTQIPMRTFIEDPHLNGYLRGLEEEMAKADVVVAAGIDDFSTQQAFRFCHEQQKPFSIAVLDQESIRRAFDTDNLEIQDMARYTQGFVVYGEDAAEYLRYMGVIPERILTLTPRIYTQRLGFQSPGRTKLRRYIGLDRQHKLVLSLDPLQAHSRAPQLLMALKYLKQRGYKQADDVRLMFTGMGPDKEQLKYLAVDAGVAKQVLFISQDINPFARDLYCAADCGVALTPYGAAGLNQVMSWPVLDFMACGLRPLVNARHPLAQELPEFCVVPNDDYEALAQQMLDILTYDGESGHERREVMDLCYRLFDASAVRESVLNHLFQGLQHRRSTQPFVAEFNGTYQRLLSGVTRVPVDELLQDIDRAWQLWEHHSDYRGLLQLLKGHALLRDQRLEEAMSCYELCTADEAVQREAFLGLGRIAYLTMAYEESMSFYRKALAIKPNDPEAMAGLGMVYRKAGMPDDAVLWLGKSLSVDLENEMVLRSLTQASLEAEDLERAISLLEQIKSLIGDKAPLIMALGQLYYRIGEVEKGRILVNKALDITESSGAGSFRTSN